MVNNASPAPLNRAPRASFPHCEMDDSDARALVALAIFGLYNARAKRRPAWNYFKHNATSRRSARWLGQGGGVFVAGGKRDMGTGAGGKSDASSNALVL